MRVVVTRRASRLTVLRRLPRDAESFYAVTDMPTVRRLGAMLWGFAGVIVAILLPIAPPEAHGGWGWVIGIGSVLACVTAAYLLLRRPEWFGGDVLWIEGLLAIAMLALLVWVAGEPYTELYLLPLIYASAVHPPRRVAVVYFAVAAALLAPQFYDGWSAHQVAEDLARMLLWSTMGFIALLFSATVKVQRLELMADEQEASREARRDPLTGLGNRRAFDEALERVVEGARDSDRPLTLVLSDIQDFKGVNDTHGHLEGDRVLREVASTLAHAVRPSDSCFRWGGDEFAVILPGATPEHAATVVERVSEAVATDVAAPGDEPIGLRFGIAEVRPDMSAEDLVAAADLSLMAERS